MYTKTIKNQNRPIFIYLAPSPRSPQLPANRIDVLLVRIKVLLVRVQVEDLFPTLLGGAPLAGGSGAILALQSGEW